VLNHQAARELKGSGNGFHHDDLRVTFFPAAAISLMTRLSRLSLDRKEPGEALIRLCRASTPGPRGLIELLLVEARKARVFFEHRLRAVAVMTRKSMTAARSSRNLRASLCAAIAMLLKSKTTSAPAARRGSGRPHLAERVMGLASSHPRRPRLHTARPRAARLALARRHSTVSASIPACARRHRRQHALDEAASGERVLSRLDRRASPRARSIPSHSAASSAASNGAAAVGRLGGNCRYRARCRRGW